MVDPHGASVHQTVIVTINGSNDAPVITGGVTAGAVQEDLVPAASGFTD